MGTAEGLLLRTWGVSPMRLGCPMEGKEAAEFLERGSPGPRSGCPWRFLCRAPCHGCGAWAPSPLNPSAPPGGRPSGAPTGPPRGAGGGWRCSRAHGSGSEKLRKQTAPRMGSQGGCRPALGQWWAPWGAGGGWGREQKGGRQTSGLAQPRKPGPRCPRLRPREEEAAALSAETAGLLLCLHGARAARGAPERGRSGRVGRAGRARQGRTGRLHSVSSGTPGTASAWGARRAHR